MASQRESGRVIHDGLQARYRMTHKESERCSKHNDDVETVVEKTGVWPCEREKKGTKGKKTRGNENVGNTLCRIMLIGWHTDVAHLPASSKKKGLHVFKSIQSAS